MADLSAQRNFDLKDDSKSLLRMDMGGVLKIGGKKFAANLLWLTFDEATSSVDTIRSQKKLRHDLIKPDFIGERSNLISQQGYGHIKKGHKLGMPVAAAIITDILVGEWHGCFKTDNGWWYVAVHGDAIAPDGDLFFDNEEEAYAHFSAANERQNWPRSYAPSQWSVDDTTEDLDLESLFANAIPTTLLKPVTLTAVFGTIYNVMLFFAALAFLSLVLLAFAVTNLGDYFSPAPEVKRNVVLDITDPIIIPPKFVNNVDVSNALLEIDDYAAPDLIALCLNTFEDLFVPLPGWAMKQISCREGSVMATWDRSTARIADLNSLRDRFDPSVVMSYDGQSSLTVRQPLDLTQLEKVTMSVKSKEYLYAILTMRLEDKGQLGVAQVEVPAPSVVNPDTGEVLTPPPDLFLSVEFLSPISAYEWLDDFDIQGMRPLELTWSVGDSQWRVSGLVQYQ